MESVLNAPYLAIYIFGMMLGCNVVAVNRGSSEMDAFQYRPVEENDYADLERLFLE